jgi:hypothetical protein
VEGVGASYADHLTDHDLDLLARLGAADLRRQPEAIPRLLSERPVFDAILGTQAKTAAPILDVSPFLLFAVIVHRAAADLSEMTYVTERTGLRERVPVFDGPQLAEFLAQDARRLLIAELLASFTRVASGRYRVRTQRGWRWRRYSELDLPHLAGLLDTANKLERPGLYRRLGDVALFLAGVFPEYTQRQALSPIAAARLLRLVQPRDNDERDRLAAAPALELYEELGARWYRTAWELAPVRTERLAVVVDVAGRFRQARRVLNHITDRYLFPIIERGELTG